MENLKHTKEYAVELGGKHVETHKDSEVRRMHGHYTRMFADGYMKAIEETGVADLLEALIELENKAISIMQQLVDSPSEITNDATMKKVRNARNKATK